MVPITDSQRVAFQAYTQEFESTYLLQPLGQQHIVAYAAERAEVQRAWDDITLAKRQGRDITTLVLDKLLPYSNTLHNRQQGYRISVTPAITSNLRKWFENAGWQKPGNWGAVAEAIYEVVHRLVEQGDWQALVEFEANQTVSKGIRSGFLTPTFHFLDERFRTINSKTIDTVNFLLGRRAIANELGHYQEYLRIIDAALSDLNIPLFYAADIFDAFCHWMCSKRLGGYARIEHASVQIAEEVGGDEIDDGATQEEGPAVFEQEAEPQTHWEAVYYVVKLGNLLGYSTYVADPSRTAFGKRLGDIATLSEVPAILRSAPEVQRIDAIWYRPKPPLFFFEVEDGGTMRDALHRLYNTMAFDGRFVVVCPLHNRDKFAKWVSTAPFKEYEDRYNFRTYAELFEFYRETDQFTAMSQRFLRV
jgi:hypothetical protein